jgi:hypothetical protein
MRSMLATLNSVRQVALGNVRRDLRPNASTRWIDSALLLKRKCVDGVRNLARIAGAVRRASSTLDQVMRYRPKVYRGPITVIASAQWSRLGVPDQWRHLAGDKFVIHTLAGTHESYLRDSPEAAARLLDQCLAEARKDLR